MNVPTPLRWFEFLLEPGRLQHHLETEGSDPSPIELINLFFRNMPNLEDTSQMSLVEAKYFLRKTHALKRLAIKVGSFLKWDLDVICSGLNIPTQYKLMQAIKEANLHESCPEEVKQFTTIMYSHWFLRSAMTYRMSTLQPQSNSTTVVYLSPLQQQQQTDDNLALAKIGALFSDCSSLRNCSDQLHKYIWELVAKDHDSNKSAAQTHPFKEAKLSRPTMECWHDTPDWNQSELIEPTEVMSAACYELGKFLFFEEDYPAARDTFNIIRESIGRYPSLETYLKSANDILATNLDEDSNGTPQGTNDNDDDDAAAAAVTTDNGTGQQLTLRLDAGGAGTGSGGLQATDMMDHTLLEINRGDSLMAQGQYKEAIGCFVGAIMLMTDYFRVFSENYAEEESCILRLIHCSISLSCYTQAVALCQMTRYLNYHIAFKQLNERVCNDCCDDIYECIWNVTLLEYITSLHAKRGEVERRNRAIQLLGQLELNENNPEEVLREAEHVRRGRFFRIMSNKYL